jgi:hypothetical protein
MQRFGNTGPDDPELEARLRAERPRPSAELVERIVGGSMARRLRPRLALRVAVAAALTVALAVGGLAAGGGDPIRAFEQAAKVAQGSSGASNANQGSGGKQTQANGSGGTGGTSGNAGQSKPADDQYGDRITICHRGNSPNNPGQTLTLPRQAAEAHLRQHRYDTRGPCPPPPPPQDTTICHRNNRNDRGQTLTVSQQAADQHLRNHRYDTRGPCPQ